MWYTQGHLEWRNASISGPCENLMLSGMDPLPSFHPLTIWSYLILLVLSLCVLTNLSFIFFRRSVWYVTSCWLNSFWNGSKRRANSPLAAILGFHFTSHLSVMCLKLHTKWEPSCLTSRAPKVLLVTEALALYFRRMWHLLWDAVYAENDFIYFTLLFIHCLDPLFLHTLSVFRYNNVGNWCVTIVFFINLWKKKKVFSEALWSVFIHSFFTFTFIHLEDAFIQSDLHYGNTSQATVS